MNKFVALITLLSLAGCVTDDAEAYSTLDQFGFTNAKTGGWAFFGCGKGDKAGREFTATNSNGRQVSGMVCCGILKSCTIRF